MDPTSSRSGGYFTQHTSSNPSVELVAGKTRDRKKNAHFIVRSPEFGMKMSDLVILEVRYKLISYRRDEIGKRVSSVVKEYEEEKEKENRKTENVFPQPHGNFPLFSMSVCRSPELCVQRFQLEFAILASEPVHVDKGTEFLNLSWKILLSRSTGLHHFRPLKSLLYLNFLRRGKSYVRAIHYPLRKHAMNGWPSRLKGTLTR